MSTAPAVARAKSKQARRAPKRISKEHFLRYYSNREDGYKYEYNHGLVEKTETMNQRQSRFLILLFDLFFKTQAYKKGDRLVAETDMDTSPLQLRRPDMAYYTAEQLPKMWAGENQVAPLVIEVISPTDRAENINAKLVEYFHAGVGVVWHIFPDSQKVDVYTSPEQVTICRGATICTGEPVIQGFEIRAEELFL